MTVQQPHASASDAVKIGVPVAIGAVVAIAIGVYAVCTTPPVTPSTSPDSAARSARRRG